MPTRDTAWPAGTPCWVDLSVPDVAAATAFYGPVLDWTFVDSGVEFGGYHMARAGDRAAAGVGPIMQEGQPAAWTVYLASDDADATTKLISENGGTVLAEPMDLPGLGRMAIAMDAAGGVFGVWQSAGMNGAEVYNEPGSLIWTDARLTDTETGRRFYAAVFGHTFGAVPGAPDDYATFAVDGGTVGGMGGMMGAPEGTPSHWLPYFMVADVDAASAAVSTGGGTVPMPPTDTSFGRMGIVTDPFGATFALHGGMPIA